MIKKSKYQNKNNRNWVWLNLLIVLSSLCPIFIGSFGAFRAIANEETNSNPDTPVLFQPPPGEEKPKNTKGGGSRGERNSCIRDIETQQKSGKGKDSILQDAVLPEGASLREYKNMTTLGFAAIAPHGYSALTIAERPTFWVNLPKTSAQQAILVIKKGDRPDWYRLATHSQQSINLTGDTGIVGIKLSEDAPALETGENYQWIVMLVCGNKPSPNDPLVTAGIKRIDRSQIGDEVLTTSTELNKASLYAQKSIWYDALDILVAQKSSLNDWNDIWVKYLQSGGLTDEIANIPVIGRLSDKQ